MTLEIGRIYFGVGYEDDGLRYPIVHSYEYVGVSSSRPGIHLFRFVGTGNSLELADSQLDLISTVDGLTRILREWAARNPTLAA
jgi:hypothetical protein